MNRFAATTTLTASDDSRCAGLPQRFGRCIARLILGAALLVGLLTTGNASAGPLEEELKRVPPTELAAQAKATGDAARGAVVFFQPHLACNKCHTVGKPSPTALGPDLTTVGKDASDADLIESVLSPSKTIRKGFESVTAVTTSGKSVVGLVVERTKEKLVLRDLAQGGAATTIPAAELEEVSPSVASLMPAGQVDQLGGRQQFLDLVRYLMEVRDGGAARAAELQPAAALTAFVVPEYEKRLDHVGLIQGWNAESFKRGEAVYRRVCANCHGTKDAPGSLPNSLRFAEGKFKNGGDPLAMYRTLTYGFGMMTPQTWMAPSQKYDVIHYVREAYLKPHNPSQWTAVDAKYLAGLPSGDTKGPAPSTILPWSAMDYGTSLTHTFEVPGGKRNIAYKGTAVRLDPGPGGASRGRAWMLFDSDTLRAAAGWTGTGGTEENFIDWQGIQFNGAHGVHPRLVGRTAFVNSTNPGWADPARGSFVDDARVLGRDGRRYGPLPKSWGRYLGRYQHGDRVVFAYKVGNAEVLESPTLAPSNRPGAPERFVRSFEIGPRDRELLLQAAEHPSPEARPTVVPASGGSVVLFAPPDLPVAAGEAKLEFDGNTFLELPAGKEFDLTGNDFTILAKIATSKDGTIWSLSQEGPKWTPDGQTFFVRDGRLCFDVGWVGAVSGKAKVADGASHVVAATWERSAKKIRLYVDGKLDAEGTLAAKAPLPKGIVRIGFTSPDFPRPASLFTGEVAEVRFHQKRLTAGLGELGVLQGEDAKAVARWLPGEAAQGKVPDASGRGRDAVVRRGMAPVRSPSAPILAGFAPADASLEWTSEGGALRLRIPPGKETIRFSIWLPAEAPPAGTAEADAFAKTLANEPLPEPAPDLASMTRGGPIRRPEQPITTFAGGDESGPLAVDVLTPPEPNPWLALTRFTGLDFFPDGRIAVCTWDGDVWTVETLPPDGPAPPGSGRLKWRRIATGLFQPLGLRIVGGKVHLACRDQLAVLEDLNGDGEIDFVRCLNDDHQATEHFHEFAMGLQTDAAGDFYYAKSGLHGLPAVVPHHGTLLKVAADGSKTEILATGFRAANGVCLNPDGSFFVTDQEGFWNPKNRINWVTADPGGQPKFYGNMLGYHDVKDPSDAAMEPPLCWVDNAFDRSPAELLWVEGKRWGALEGALLNLSYGTGKAFVVPHEKVQGKLQGGMAALPLPTFPTGVMRGRFDPADGNLYLCGMFAWAGNATAPGGLYRVRPTGKPLHVPVGLKATKSGLALKFTEPLDPAGVDAAQIRVKTWSIKRSGNYGSKKYDEKPLPVRSAKLSADGRTLLLGAADLQPTWCMEIEYTLRGADGTTFHGVVQNTIHNLGE